MTTTGWVLVWVVLLVAALGFFAFIAWHLFKKVQGFLTQASASAEIFDTFAQAMQSAQTNEYQPVHAFAGDAAQKEQWRMLRRLNRIKRGNRKLARRQATLDRWKELTVPPEQGLD